MKKVYNAPQTEAIKMNAVGTLCAGSPTSIRFGGGEYEGIFE